jgi:hypothetical protein
MPAEIKWTVVPRARRSKSESFVYCKRVEMMANLDPVEKQTIQKIINEELRDYIDTEINYIKHNSAIGKSARLKMVNWLNESKHRFS